mgnify:CR=1 FL=1
MISCKNFQSTPTLVIGDIHQNIQKLESTIYTLKGQYENILVLGDWFDTHVFEDRASRIETAKYFAEFLHTPGQYSLVGNHDLQYLYLGNSLRCSGFSEAFRNWMWNDEGKKTRLSILQSGNLFWFAQVEQYLCTHGGLHPRQIPIKIGIPTITMDKVYTWLEIESRKANEALTNCFPHWFWSVGKARGGNLPQGGILWLDFNQEFEHIVEIPQIVGHTPGDEIRQEGNSFCIDSTNEDYLLIPDLRNKT